MHDALGRTVAKARNGNLEKGYLWGNQLQLLAELNATGQVVSRFVYATRVNVPEYMVSKKLDGTNWKTYRIITNHLGSPRLVVDVDTGAIAQEMTYDEFGNVLSDNRKGFQPFGFAGGLYDPDTKLVRFGARDYDAFTGRWTAKDPIRFRGGDANLYGYVAADPVNWVDPMGLWGLKDAALGGSGMGVDFSYSFWSDGKWLNSDKTQASVSPTLLGGGLALTFDLPFFRELMEDETNISWGFGVSKYLSLGMNANGDLLLNLGVGIGPSYYFSVPIGEFNAYESFCTE
jgi:RHS repeat-associated protein